LDAATSGNALRPAEKANLIATLGVPVGAEAAPRAVQAASISSSNCFAGFHLEGSDGFWDAVNVTSGRARAAASAGLRSRSG
jgi:hypothetical protein